MSVSHSGTLPVHQQVAAEVRAALARANLSGNRAALRLGWKQQYLSRRLSGTVPFDVSELYALAELLDVPVADFLPLGRPGRVGRRIDHIGALLSMAS